MHESTILNKACSVVLHVLRNHTRFSLDDNDNFGRVVVRDPAIKHFDAFGFPARSFVVIELVGKFGKGVAVSNVQTMVSSICLVELILWIVSLGNGIDVLRKCHLAQSKHDGSICR